jgi:hypothetical protein
MGMGKGGHMTISPPANVKTTLNENFHVLASGIDTLVLAIDVNWQESKLLSYLETLKNDTQVIGTELPGVIRNADQSDEWKFIMQPYGSRGYPWLLVGREFTLKIGKSIKPKSRPSIMAELRSEMLWTQSPPKAVKRIVNLLTGAGASIMSIKPSRTDLCLDLLVPEDFWSLEIMKYAVKRAKQTGFYTEHKGLTGIVIGRGAISARIYDKVLEIRHKSEKYWMFDVWGLNEVTGGKRIIRIEFQLRREVIKSLGMHVIAELFAYCPSAWAYCTQNWLKFQDCPGLHHTQRATLPWWQIVQKGFLGVQDAKPSIREKAFRGDKKQLALQAYGQLTSLAAVVIEERPSLGEKQLGINDVFDILALELGLAGKNKADLNDRVVFKRAKYNRTRITKHKEGYTER